MPLAAHDLTRKEVFYIGTDLDNFPDELVPDNHWHRNSPLSPRVPFVNVQIGATNAGLENPDEHIVDAHRRLRNILQPKPRLGFRFDERFHG